MTIVVVRHKSLTAIGVMVERLFLGFVDNVPRHSCDGANGIDVNWLDDVFAGASIGIESEFIVVSAPLTEIDRMTEGHIEDANIFRRVPFRRISPRFCRSLFI